MLKWFCALLKAMVLDDCYLQTFHAGYKSDINADNLTNGDLKEYPMLCVVAFFNSEESVKDNSERFFITLEFLTPQGYKNDNTPDIDHQLVEYFDEVQTMGRSFITALETVFKKISMTPGTDMQLSLDNSAPRKWRRSAFAHNDRLISLQVDLVVVFKSGIFNCPPSCDCNKVCIPVFTKPDPNKLLTGLQQKC